MEVEIIWNLLKQISTITNHYQKQSFLSGEEFNIFKILDITPEEVRGGSVGNILIPG